MVEFLKRVLYSSNVVVLGDSSCRSLGREGRGVNVVYLGGVVRYSGEKVSLEEYNVFSTLSGKNGTTWYKSPFGAPGNIGTAVIIQLVFWYMIFSSSNCFPRYMSERFRVRH